VFEFATKGQYAHIVTALSTLCSAPVPLVDELLQSKHREAILIACKAAELEWPTVKAVLIARSLGKCPTSTSTPLAPIFSDCRRAERNACCGSGRSGTPWPMSLPIRSRRTGFAR
jgi:Uncharacterised protein conserved in bacteria (DUF2336)